jgi:hypothetical protein
VCVQLEGPLSPAELVEILQTTLEEQGLAFGSAKAKRDEKIRADRRLREMQDAAYFKALQIDQVVNLYIYTSNMNSTWLQNPSTFMHLINLSGRPIKIRLLIFQLRKKKFKICR